MKRTMRLERCKDGSINLVVPKRTIEVGLEWERRSKQINHLPGESDESFIDRLFDLQDQINKERGAK